jgi:uncharacterized membrane protein SpoIIM required for sporulation
MLQALSIIFAAAAVLLIGAAIVLMVRDENERRGYRLRIAAVACFAIAVVLNVIR